MNVARYREQAQRGLAILEEAVLGVMFESNPTPLAPSRVSHLAGIPKSLDSEAYHTANDTLTRLESKGLVRRKDPDKPGRILTEKGIRKLKGN